MHFNTLKWLLSALWKTGQKDDLLKDLQTKYLRGRGGDFHHGEVGCWIQTLGSSE